MSELRKIFRPEFINRLDEIIVFHELTRVQLETVVELMVRDLQKRLAERKLSIEITMKAKAWLAEEGYDPAFGARPLRRVIQRYVENPLSTRLLRGELKEGDAVQIDLSDGDLTFAVKEVAKATA